MSQFLPISTFNHKKKLLKLRSRMTVLTITWQFQLVQLTFDLNPFSHYCPFHNVNVFQDFYPILFLIKSLFSSYLVHIAVSSGSDALQQFIVILRVSTTNITAQHGRPTPRSSPAIGRRGGTRRRSMIVVGVGVDRGSR